MNVFLYKKELYIPDKTAKQLHLTIEKPYLSLWEDAQHRFYLTHTSINLKNSTFHGYFDCFLEATGWKGVGLFPFPWEKEYSFQYFKHRMCILEKNKTKKEVISYESRIKTLPKTRYRKAKQIQNMRNTQQTQNREDPHFINTLL